VFPFASTAAICAEVVPVKPFFGTK
jgi:hypothetical protein